MVMDFLRLHYIYIISRVILAENDALTPFDLRAKIFRVNVELSGCYRGLKIKGPKGTVSKNIGE